MTLDEIDKIAQIVGKADGGCGYCVAALARDIEVAFPQFRIDADGSRDDHTTFGLRARLATEGDRPAGEFWA